MKIIQKMVKSGNLGKYSRMQLLRICLNRSIEKIMKKEYIAPESKVIEMKAEGVLCDSVSGASIQKWTNADNGKSIWDK